MKKKLSLYFVFLSSILFSQTAPDINFVYSLPDSLKADTLVVLAKKNRGANIELSLFYAQKASEFALITKDSIQLGNSYNSIGNCKHLMGNYEEALRYYFKAMQVFENMNFIKGIASSSINIGVLNYDKGKYEDAINYYRKAIVFSIQTNNIINTASGYNNIGICYKMLNQLDSSLFYALKALEVRKKFAGIELKRALSTSYSNLAILYMALKDYPTAEKYYFLTLNELEGLDDNTGRVECLNNIGDYYIETGHVTKGIDYLNQAEALALKEKLTPELVNIYYNFSIAYKKKENYKLSGEYLEKYILIKDSLDNVHNREMVEDMQVKYDTEKKELQIKNQSIEITAQEKQNKQKSIIILLGTLALVGTGFFGIIAFINFRKSKKANTIIQHQNTEIILQKEIVEEKQKEIVDSINYAKRIQYTLLAHDAVLKENLKDYFIYFNPKDIVSGDFYWATTHNNKFYLAVCDSTGHGVPGAFMSLLNISFLNEAITERNIEQPNEIFNYVRQRLTDSVSKDGQKDGFDGVLLCIDKINNIISYAAANNAPIIVTNNEYKELPKNRMPVGVGERKESFSLHKIEIIEGDILYLYTDGYADQFGGERGKKFKYKTLNELISLNACLPLPKQSEILTQKFSDWKGTLEQVDDVCLIGIRL